MAQRSLLLAGIGQLLLDAPCQFVLALRCDERAVARRFEASRRLWSAEPVSGPARVESPSAEFEGRFTQGGVPRLASKPGVPRCGARPVVEPSLATARVGGCFGGPGEIRTHDLFHAMEARSQLRHRPTSSSRLPATPVENDLPLSDALPTAPQAHLAQGYLPLYHTRARTLN